MGVLTALAGRDDLIVSDALNRASLVDSSRLSRARVAMYAHGDACAAAAAAAGRRFRRRLLVTDRCSASTRRSPFGRLAEAAAATDSVLIVDEAHALGVLGPGGRGPCAGSGIVPDVLIGTLGKAVGSAGGFAAGVPALRDLLVDPLPHVHFHHRCHPPRPPPPRLVSGFFGPRRRRRAQLAEHRHALGEALLPRRAVSADPIGPIAPVLSGSESRRSVAAALNARGLFIPAIRPPTVRPAPRGFGVTLRRPRAADLDRLVTALDEVLT